MSGRHSACYGPEIPFDREYKNVNNTTLYNVDPYLNFQIAFNDMLTDIR